MHIVVLTEKPFSAAAKKAIKEVADASAHTLEFVEKYTSEHMKAAVRRADGIIVRSDRVSDNVLSSAPELKLVVRAGAGYDTIDVGACRERGVVVMNTPGQNAEAVAELAMLLMLFAYRNMLRAGVGRELKGKRLGVCGYGNVGRLVAERAGAFGMECLGYDPVAPPRDAARTLEEVFERCDVVSLNMPLTAETRGVVTYELVKKMPLGGVICNTARSEVVDEEGLLRAMRERKDLAYVSDLPLKTGGFEDVAERVFVTPRKMGADTDEANTRAGVAAVKQSIAFFDTGCVAFKVN